MLVKDTSSTYIYIQLLIFHPQFVVQIIMVSVPPLALSPSLCWLSHAKTCETSNCDTDNRTKSYLMPPLMTPSGRSLSILVKIGKSKL